MLGRRKKTEIEDKTPEITKLILDAKAKAQKETGVMEVLPPKRIKWPREGTVGPGLEGAVACGPGDLVALLGRTRRHPFRFHRRSGLLHPCRDRPTLLQAPTSS